MKNYYEYWFEKDKTILTVRYSNKAYIHNQKELDLIDFDEWIDKLTTSITFSACLTNNGYELVLKETDDEETKLEKQKKWEEFKLFYQDEIVSVYKKKKLKSLG